MTHTSPPSRSAVFFGMIMATVAALLLITTWLLITHMTASLSILPIIAGNWLSVATLTSLVIQFTTCEDL